MKCLLCDCETISDRVNRLVHLLLNRERTCFLCALFQECVALEELYLSHNGISKMEGLSSLVNLKVLDVSSNKLKSVDDIENLTQYVYFRFPHPPIMTFYLWLLFKWYILTFLPHSSFVISNFGRLEDLWLNDNHIESLEGIAEAVTASRDKLATIYLENNPCVWLLATWMT